MRLGRFLRFTLLLIVLAGVYSSVRAQVYDLEILDSESGIVGSQVNDLCQDARGYIWIATSSGVSRFDGKEFKNYHKRDGLSENHCSAIICDRNGRVWIGHQTTGLSLIAGDSIINFSEADGLANNEVHDILESEDGSIWIATFGGVSKLDSTSWKNITITEGLSMNNSRCLLQDAKGDIWVGTYGAGINIISDENVASLSSKQGLANNYITDIGIYKGQVLVGTLNGISILQRGSFASPTFSDAMVNSQINSISINKNGDLWLGTFNGATRVRDNETLNLTETNGLSSNEVLCVLNDREGNTWLGTRKGLVRLKNMAFAHYFSSDDIDIEPTAIFKDSEGIIWAGNETGGVLKYDGHSFVQAFSDPDINDRQISAIGEDGFGSIWFGTMDFGGLFQWDGRKLYIYSDEFGLADNNINCLAQDAEGNLVIGTPSGLSIYDGSGFSIVNLSDDVSGKHVTALETSTNGTVVVGTADGKVYILDGRMAEPIDGVDANSPITDICESDLGLTIISQVDGMFLVKNGSVRHLDEGSGLRGSSLRSVAQLGKNLYLGTAQGLQQLWFIGDSLITRTFDYSRGFLGKTCKRGSILSEGNNLWVGTTEGITRFTTKERTDDLHEPLTSLTQLQLDLRDVDWKALGYETEENGFPINLKLSYTENSLRFFFKGINHRQPEAVTYKWILEGFETSWNPPTTQEYVNYPNLPPGNYTFKLVACNSFNICSQEPVTFSFKITPPLWRTWPFYITVAVIVLIATYLYILIRERRLKEEKKILETTVQERTKELREQKEIVEGQNKNITESIEYARNIQMAVLPSEAELSRAFEDHFVFYRPKDTVGGDFYWVFVDGDVTWAAAVDCTGHGVAGAFMSMIGTDLLNQIIIEKKVSDPARVLDEMDKGIKLAFAQSAKEFETDQGMDMSLVKIDRRSKTLEFAGAQRPLYIYQDGSLLQIDGNRHSISCAEQRGAEPFARHKHIIKGNSVAYLFSDGIVDQFGGPNGKKFMIRRLREFLQTNGQKPLNEQAAELTRVFDEWIGDESLQVDDVMLLGIRL